MLVGLDNCEEMDSMGRIIPPFQNIFPGNWSLDDDQDGSEYDDPRQYTPGALFRQPGAGGRGRGGRGGRGRGAVRSKDSAFATTDSNRRAQVHQHPRRRVGWLLDWLDGYALNRVCCIYDLLLLLGVVLPYFEISFCAILDDPGG